MDFSFIIGIIGAVLILMAFFLNQVHRWKDADIAYDVTNLIGSGMLLYYSIISAVWPFAILNFVWLLVSLRDVIFRSR